jgi:hypothetical protein
MFGRPIFSSIEQAYWFIESLACWEGEKEINGICNKNPNGLSSSASLDIVIVWLIDRLEAVVKWDSNKHGGLASSTGTRCHNYCCRTQRVVTSIGNHPRSAHIGQHVAKCNPSGPYVGLGLIGYISNHVNFYVSEPCKLLFGPPM